MAPQGHHAMSDMARESFVVTTGTLGSAASAAVGEVKAATSLKKSKKSSKKKKLVMLLEYACLFDVVLNFSLSLQCSFVDVEVFFQVSCK